MDTPKVLIVEDEAIPAEALKRQLEELGYHVVGVQATGVDAVRAAEELDPDVVVMDIMLRGEMDGIEAARQIRKKQRIPVVYVTGFTSTRAFKLIKRLYPSHYLTKPFSVKDLQNVIENALES
jgi:CheY-like chemotaxis protein